MGPGSRYRLAGTTMNLNLRLWQNPWRLMLAVNAAVLIGVFWHKITLPPYVPYIHLLVDYHFGFTKRALIGAIVSLFTAKVPVWLVFALAGTVWLVTAGLFVQLFRRTFGFDEKHLPLFVFMAGSPFFLKNFMHTLGHFDIYGCLFAICLLLIPARSIAYVLLAAMFSIVLVLIHHIHLLMYVPTIAAIVVLRHYLVHGVNRQNVDRRHRMRSRRSACFSSPRNSTARCQCRRQSSSPICRAGWPTRREPNLLSFGYIWYQPLSKEICDTWARLPHNLLGVPVFALLIWLHTPLWRYFRNLIAALSVDAHRHIVTAAIVNRQPRLSRHVRDRVRLFPLDFELGGVPVPDPARGESAAGFKGHAADISGRPEDDDLRLDRHADPARRDRAAVLDSDRDRRTRT